MEVKISVLGVISDILSRYPDELKQDNHTGKTGNNLSTGTTDNTLSGVSNKTDATASALQFHHEYSTPHSKSVAGSTRAGSTSSVLGTESVSFATRVYNVVGELLSMATHKMGGKLDDRGDTSKLRGIRIILSIYKQ